MNLKIRTIKEKDLTDLWQVAYQDNLEWTKWDGPYFNDPIYTKDEFVNEAGPKYYQDKQNKALIEYNDEIVGLLTYHFEDGKLEKWLEFGIVIYTDKYWGCGIGTKALTQWIDMLFKTYPEVQRVGFTTWSKNERMMALGEKLNMRLEARIRQVRYYENRYWDSIKYGILRSEWEREENRT